MPKAKPAQLTPKNPADGEWRPAFLAHLSKTANVPASAMAAGITRQGAYKAKGIDPAFSAAWDDAIEDAVDILEEEARRRGMETSDTLLIFLLKAHRPDKYRDKPSTIIDANAQGGVQIYLPERKQA